MTDRTLVIYHNADLDGWCSGALTALHLTQEEKEFDLLGMNYGDLLDMKRLVDYREVIMVDFSLPRRQMEVLNKETSLCWYDHHKSAMDEMIDLNISGWRREGRAACEILWHVFFPSQGMPPLVNYLGVYDTWRFRDQAHAEAVQAVQYGARFHAPNPNHDLTWWEHAFFLSPHELFHQLEQNGAILYHNAIKQVQEKLLPRIGKEKLLGRPVLYVNGVSNILPSLLQGDPNLPSDVEFLVMFQFTGGRWVYTLRQIRPDGPDLSAIATTFGGGGHRNAAGFIRKCTDPFSIFLQDGPKEVK